MREQISRILSGRFLLAVRCCSTSVGSSLALLSSRYITLPLFQVHTLIGNN